MSLEQHGMINFRCSILPPPTHQAALRVLKNKSGKMFIGKQSNSKASQWMKAFKLLIRQHKPNKPMDGPLRMSINFAYPLLKEHEGKHEVIAKITRPDCDNLVKSVLDCLVDEGFLVDDSRIVHLNVYKCHHYYGPFVDVIATTEVENPWKRPDGTDALLDD
jgi:Holliday junction resolvase RusA-like endonuclease